MKVNVIQHSGEMGKVVLITEAKLLKIAISNIYHDNSFLEFLKSLKAKLKDHHAYLKDVDNSVELIIVFIKKSIQDNPPNTILVNENILKAQNCMYHLGINTLRKFLASKLDCIIPKIEKTWE